MKVHNVEIRVFCKPEDSLDKVRKCLLSFIPFDLSKEKVKLNEKNATGFGERKIVILETKLNKQRHVNQFLKNLNEMVSNEQKDLIKSQAESRLDDEMCFYLRFDKQKLMDKGKLWLIDKGDCYHIRLSVAAFPKTRENALNTIKTLF